MDKSLTRGIILIIFSVALSFSFLMQVSESTRRVGEEYKIQIMYREDKPTRTEEVIKCVSGGVESEVCRIITK